MLKFLKREEKKLILNHFNILEKGSEYK